VRFVPRLRSLVTDAIVIEDVFLEVLQVAALRDAEGHWHVPVALPADPAEGEPRLAVQRTKITGGRVAVFDGTPGGTAQAAGEISDIEATLAGEPDRTRLRDLRARVGRAALRGEAEIEPGAVRMNVQVDGIRDDDLPALLGLLGAERPEPLGLPDTASATVSVQMNRATGELTGRGRLGAPAVRLDPLVLRDFEAPLRIDQRRLALDPATFTLHGGTHRGRIAIDLRQAPATWSLDSTLDTIDVGDFLGTLAEGGRRLQGRGRLSAALQGRAGEPLAQTLRGRARVTVVDGVVQDFPLLSAVNQALKVADTHGRDVRFSRLSATLDIAAGRARTEDLLLEAADVRIPLTGGIGLAGALDLTGRVVFSAARSAEMIRSVRELTGLRNTRGEIEVPVTITGTADDPSFALDLQAMLGKAVEDELRRRLRRLIP
jgi:hypothetical protein